MTKNSLMKFGAEAPRAQDRRGWILVLLAALVLVGVNRYLEWRGDEPTGARTAPTPTPAPIPTPQPVPAPEPATPAPLPAPAQKRQPQPAPTPAPKPAPKVDKPAIPGSQATNARAYRQDAARHLYARNAARIYKGKLQPLLYAVGVLQVSIDGNGRVRSLHWMRAPRHAPEVIREIERTVRAAAPYPAPVRMGNVVYTDTWLWDKSGRFQLDTLTEGQL